MRGDINIILGDSVEISDDETINWRGVIQTRVKFDSTKKRVYTLGIEGVLPNYFCKSLGHYDVNFLIPPPLTSHCLIKNSQISKHKPRN